ncbi:MAG: DNA mismatch repair protein MutS [Bacteroidetes bacterium]|nr:DNA mismatch repair protein MutS [Bacteroidota bacterium]
MSKSGQDTPLMRQHHAIKQRYPDAILLFRVGDFYETFGEDAIRASQVLGITLTKRNNGAAASSELAGFPHHSLDSHLHKLVRAGFRVAICDQLEDPKLAKGIVKRGVTELVTPGLATSEKLLETGSNNFLASIHFTEGVHGVSFLDMSTGEFFLAEGDNDAIDKLLQTLQPMEVIFSRSYQKSFRESYGNRFHTYALEPWIFDGTYAREILLKHFGTHSLKGFGVEDMPAAIVSAGAVLHYLRDTEHPNLSHITALQRVDKEEHVWMDRFTVRNLELTASPIENGATLLRTIDKTVSPMGARLMRRWILLPLLDIRRIQERLDLTEYLMAAADTRSLLLQHIRACGDLERLAARIPMRRINPRELLQVARALHHTQQIREAGLLAGNDYLRRLSDAINPCAYIMEKILREIADDPPANFSKGGVIAEGVHDELDKLRRTASGGRGFLTELQSREAEKTGISSLKVGYNNVFGYYLEVTHAHRSKVPPEWIRRQTLTQAERYVTPELQEYEQLITGAEERIQQIEAACWEQLLTELCDYIQPLQVNAQMLAIIDCICSFAQQALSHHYHRPVLHEGATLDIIKGRHPVIECQLPPGEAYIPNDVLLDREDQQIIILTGPNMSGKSALLRQTALITLLAHMGSFVPAEKAEVPITDRIFTRVGASDNLSGGESTFMVEMNETASIVNNLSPRSLILLDEIGRGTSTYDGISLAWSLVEHLHASQHKPRTLFATHYHELNELEQRLPGVRNFHVTHRESGNRILFLRKLEPGGSTHSFGIHVARMAGMPQELLHRAEEILHQLEEFRSGPAQKGSIPPPRMPNLQLSIFDAHTETFTEIRRMLQGIDINRLTPVEALLKLNEIKGRLG